jgi:hypothetical protein
MPRNHGKSTNEEMERRIELVAAYIMAHPLCTRFDLHKQFVKVFKVPWRQIDEYSTRARKLLSKRVAMSRSEAAELCKEILLNCVKHHNPMIRMRAEERLAKIFGVDAPARVEVGGIDGQPLQFVPLTVDPKKITGGQS